MRNAGGSRPESNSKRGLGKLLYPPRDRLYGMYALSYRCSRLTLLAFTLSVAGSLQTASGDAITEVNQGLLASIRIDAPSPPVAARDIAMVNIAMYDAVNAATGLNYQPYSYSRGTVSGISAAAGHTPQGIPCWRAFFRTEIVTEIGSGPCSQ